MGRGGAGVVIGVAWQVTSSPVAILLPRAHDDLNLKSIDYYALQANS